MVSKTFEHSLPFQEVMTRHGPAWYPLVTINLICHDGSSAAIPVLFDTGADTTTLRAELAPLLGVSFPQDGHPVTIATGGGDVTMYRFTARFDVFGKQLECPVLLTQLPPNLAYMGLLGREDVFEHFGFGFWEKDHELLITSQP